MPAIVVFILGTGALWLGVRAVNRAMERVASDLRAAENEISQRDQAAIRLEADPVTGVYRPRAERRSSSH